MADLNQFLNGDLSADDIAHTNGYANVAGGGADGLSMEQRRKLANQPRVISPYQYSRLGRQRSSIKAKTANQDRGRVYDASSDSFADAAQTSNRQKADIRDSKQVGKSSLERRQHFIEPSERPRPRGYDPFV